MDRPDLELLRGAIDMHAHTAPALFQRHIDDAALAEYAIRYGMRGFVLKDHDASTTGRAYYVNRMYPQVESFGSVVLNRSVGGLDPYVAEAAIHYGAKVVWMPSNHSKYHADFLNISDYPQFGRTKRQLPGEGVTVFEDDGATLTRAARTICEVVAENGVALATGHLSLPEIRALQDAAVEAGVDRFIVTHANWSLCKLDLDVQRDLLGAAAVRARRMDHRAPRRRPRLRLRPRAVRGPSASRGTPDALGGPALGRGTVRVPREDDEGQPGRRAGARSRMDACDVRGPARPAEPS